uniref:Uncharacterized protein n=1 Tax=viral metagenome TaxID=1070528 RepID=A0A6C0C8P8_9ZZZZ
MDQYLYIRSLVNAKFLTSIFVRSESRQHKSLDITLNGPIFVHSKSRQRKILDINIRAFRVSSTQIS